MSEQDSTLDDFTKNENDSVEENTSSTQLREEGFLTLPYDWDISTVRKAAKQDGLVDGDWIESDDMDETGEIQLVQLGHLGEGQFKGEPDRFITEEFAEEENCTILSEGDLLISRMQAPILRSCLLPTFDYDSIMAVDIARLQHTDNWNRHFLKFLFNSRPIWKQGRAWASGTTRKRISRTNMEKIRLPQPTLDEQRKIATVLYTIDEAIQKTEEIIEQTERVKQGLIQNLLKEGTDNEDLVETDSRFGEIPESWDVHSLKEVGEIAGRTAPEKDQSECWGGDIPWATPSEITSLEGPTISETEEHLTEVALEKVSSNLLPAESVLLTTRATIGECAVNTVEMTTNQGFKNLIPGEQLDTWYAYYRLKYEGDYLASLSKGSTFPEVGKNTVENFVIPVPPLEEQKEIAQRLKSTDELILSYKSNRDQLQRLKQGLMQDLLSGEVRTTDADIEVLDEVRQHG